MRLNTTDRTENVSGRPRQPSDTARRLIFRYQGGQLVFLILGLAFTPIGLLFSCIFLWGLPVDLAIELTGQEVQATPTQATERTDVKMVVNGARRAVYGLEYTYELDGESFTGSSTSISAAVINAAMQQQPFPVEVAKIAPSWSRVKGSTYNFFGYLPVFVLIFPIVGLIFGGLAVRANRRQRHAFTNGEPILAQITAAGLDYSVRINRRHPFRVAWEFEHKGSRYRGTLSSMEGLEGLVVGQRLIVLYDPVRPQTNTLYLS